MQGAAGEELVFHVTAGRVGSKLRWKIELLDHSGTVLASKTVLEAGPALGYRIPADGAIFVRVSDIDSGGGKDHFYRLRIGVFPLLTSVYPLGVERGVDAEVALRGFNLGERRTAKVRGGEDWLELRPEGSHNELKLAVGAQPEVQEKGIGRGDGDRGAGHGQRQNQRLPGQRGAPI